MKIIARCLAVCACVIFVSVFPFTTAQAQAQRGWYLGVIGGYTFSPNASWEDYDYRYNLDVQKTGIFGFKFGYNPPPIKFFSFEFEYSYLNPDIDKTVLAIEGTDYNMMEGDVKLHNFMFNIFAKFPEGKIHPYVGLGVGASYFDVTVSSASRLDGLNYGNRGSADDTVFAWQVMVGVDIDLTNNLSLDIGYRYFDTEALDDYYYYDNDYYYDRYRDSDRHYHGRTFDYRTSMLTLGLKYRF